MIALLLIGTFVGGACGTLAAMLVWALCRAAARSRHECDISYGGTDDGDDG